MKNTKDCRNIILGIITALILITGFFALSKDVYAIKTPDGSTSFNSALLEDRDPNEIIDNDDREAGYVLIIEYMDRLKALYNLSPSTIQTMDDIFYQANNYVATHDMTIGQYLEYIESVQADLSAAVSGASTDEKTSDFIYICNNNAVRSASYGQSTIVTLNLVNLGTENITDIIVTPVVSTKVSEWPFDILTPSDVRMIDSLQAASTAEEIAVRQKEVSWAFVVSKDAMTGTYPLKFHVQYLHDGSTVEKDIYTYINITGAPGSGNLDSSSDDNASDTSTPRIIVTGFSTNPETVYAGDTFTLTITVQNTSNNTAVSNIQFDLKAASEGEDSKNTYEAFLPTSGSSTIYVPRIEKGASYDLTIEMTSRGDLTQKPYVIDVNADYEDNNSKSYKATTSVSIPIKQEARVDTGDADIMPLGISVGENANIMFDIYNMGKTTLYNVQVSFISSTLDGGNVFIGKLDPGATGSVDATVTGVAETVDDGNIIALISYEDESGNISTLEKQINLYVYAPMMDDMMWDDTMFYDEEMPKQGMPWWGILLIVLAIAGIITGIIIFIKKRKAASKKKSKKNGKNKYAKYKEEIDDYEEVYTENYEENYEVSDTINQTSDTNNDGDI